MELGIDLATISYFVSRESVQVTKKPGMAAWREHLFAFLLRNATPPSTYLRLPPEQTVELRLPVEL